MENIKDLLAYFEQQLRLVQSKELKYTSEEAYNDAADVCKNIINNKSEEDNGWDRAMIFNSPLKELVELKNKKDFLDSVDQSQWDEEWQKAWDDYKERKEQAWYQAKQVVMLWDKTDHGSISILKRTVLKTRRVDCSTPPM